VRALRDELATSGLRERDPEEYRQRAFELSVAGTSPTQAGPRPHAVPRRGRVQQQVWESLGDYDLLPELAALRVPHALVVHGREDPIPLASSEAGARALGARLVVLEDCGHVPYVEQPDALFAALDAFLDAPGSTPRPTAP
jgi:proline iminopeptidase